MQCTWWSHFCVIWEGWTIGLYKFRKGVRRVKELTRFEDQHQDTYALGQKLYLKVHYKGNCSGGT